MPHEDTYQFWMVWSPQGAAPRFIHTAGIEAQQEAERLATLHPGQRFYVLKGLRYVQTQVHTKVELQVPPANVSRGVPF